MSKAHIFAPLKWVKEQIKKVSNDLTTSNAEINKSLRFIANLSAAQNFDELKTTGFYTVNLWTGSGGKNSPSASTTDRMGFLIVFNNSGNVTQLYLSYDGTIRYRGCLEGTWSAWGTK
jgi:hypothetical protein